MIWFSNFPHMYLSKSVVHTAVLQTEINLGNFAVPQRNAFLMRGYKEILFFFKAF